MSVATGPSRAADSVRPNSYPRPASGAAATPMRGEGESTELKASSQHAMVFRLYLLVDSLRTGGP